MDCVSTSDIQTATHSPHIRITKHYWKSHIESIRKRFEEVKNLGSGPVEEWIKGLEEERNGRVQDAMRWEQWEAKGGLKKVNFRFPPRSTPSQKAPSIGLMNPSPSRIHNDYHLQAGFNETPTTPQVGEPSLQHGYSTRNRSCRVSSN